MSNKTWPYSNSLPSRILFPDGAEPACIHVDRILQALADDASSALANLPFPQVELPDKALLKRKVDASDQYITEMHYNHLHELDIQNRWFRGVAVVWEIAMKEKPPIPDLDETRTDCPSLKFLKFINAARLMHKGELWPLIEDDLKLFILKYRKSLKDDS